MIQSLLSDSAKCMQLISGEDKWINHIINLESKLKGRFKLLENENKLSGGKLVVFTQLSLLPAFYTVISKYIKQSLITLPNFNLFYQPLMHLHIC